MLILRILIFVDNEVVSSRDYKSNSHIEKIVQVLLNENFFNENFESLSEKILHKKNKYYS